MTFARIAAIALTLTIAATFAADASAKGKQRLYGGSSYGYQQQTTQSYYGGPSYTQSSGKYGFGTQSSYRQSFTPQQSFGKYNGGWQSSGQYYGGSSYPSQNTFQSHYGKPYPLPWYGY